MCFSTTSFQRQVVLFEGAGESRQFESYERISQKPHLRQNRLVTCDLIAFSVCDPQWWRD